MHFGNGWYDIKVPRSLGTHSSEIHTGHFVWTPDSEAPAELAPKPYIFCKPNIGFKTAPRHSHEFPEQIGADFQFNPDVVIKNGQLAALLKTSQRSTYMPLGALFDNRVFSPPYHEEDLEFSGWKAACEGDRSLTMGYKFPATELFEGPEERPGRHGTKLDLYVKRARWQGDFRKFGRSLSQARETDRMYRNLIFDPDQRTLFNSDAILFRDMVQAEFGKPTRPVPDMGIEKNEEGYAFYHAGKHYITNEVDFYKRKLSKLPESLRNDPTFVKEYLNNGLLHELTHYHQPNKILQDRNNAEITNGEFLAKFYMKLAQKFRGTKFERMYRILAAHELGYAETFKKKQGKSNIRSLSRLISKYARQHGLSESEVAEYLSRSESVEDAVAYLEEGSELEDIVSIEKGPRYHKKKQGKRAYKRKQDKRSRGSERESAYEGSDPATYEGSDTGDYQGGEASRSRGRNRRQSDKKTSRRKKAARRAKKKGSSGAAKKSK